jgi:glycosyltransferase involved in cell wall biosynthesis
MPAAVHVHGSYQLEELGAIIEKHGIESWLIPSIWPETFSYATNEAIATGLPVFCFNLGAQADAVRKAANGVLLMAPPDEPEALLSELLESIRRVAHTD